MKASDLIKVLTDKVRRHGDKEVWMIQGPDSEGASRPATITSITDREDKCAQFIILDNSAALEMGDSYVET